MIYTLESFMKDNERRFYKTICTKQLFPNLEVKQCCAMNSSRNVQRNVERKLGDYGAFDNMVVFVMSNFLGN